MHNLGVAVDKNLLKTTQLFIRIFNMLRVRFQDEINYFYSAQKSA